MGGRQVTFYNRINFILKQYFKSIKPLNQTNKIPSRSDNMTDSWETNKEMKRDNSGDRVSRFFLKGGINDDRKSCWWLQGI